MAVSSDSRLEVAAFVNKWKFVSFGVRVKDDVTLISEDTIKFMKFTAWLNRFCRMHLRNCSDHVLVFILKISTF